ncbi:hypothetical protein JOY44_06530 [Phormidium sp. CLA17]|uniref:hypothetical protein n=1 Tax=Leptolyngbya sp. Cla-17 TaxID=2803751 RepID=UPI0014917848|nr:hypothetical protein [Leptolyngbya sp. Cla-17]MBM0741277.1 hypothetical protein [Leptolyngbya sp. Cla-17]
MNSKEPRFLAENQSVTSLVAQLHNYFHNSYSRDKVARSTLLSQIEAAEDGQVLEFQKQLREIDEELVLLGILSDSLSIADRLLHMRSVRRELGPTSAAYKIHHDQSSPVQDKTA